MTPARGGIAADPNRTRDFDPYMAVNMPMMAQYRGGADASTWCPSDEGVETRAARLKQEYFVHNPWFIPHDDQWLAIGDHACSDCGLPIPCWSVTAAR
jgi:hypothetical protein